VNGEGICCVFISRHYRQLVSYILHVCRWFDVSLAVLAILHTSDAAVMWEKSIQVLNVFQATITVAEQDEFGRLIVRCHGLTVLNDPNHIL